MPLRPLRLVPDGTAIQFMRGRFAGVIVSAVFASSRKYPANMPGERNCTSPSSEMRSATLGAAGPTVSAKICPSGCAVT